MLLRRVLLLVMVGVVTSAVSMAPAHADTAEGVFMRGLTDATVTNHQVSYDPLTLSTAGRSESVQHFAFTRLISLDSSYHYTGATLDVTVLSGSKLCIAEADANIDVATITDVPASVLVTCAPVHKGRNTIDVSSAVVNDQFDQNGAYTFVYSGNARITGAASAVETVLNLEASN